MDGGETAHFIIPSQVLGDKSLFGKQCFGLM
jgi:hypothetical protein